MESPLYAPGQIVPGTVYRVVGELGAAGLGSVYEVEDTSVGRRYGLKTLAAVASDIEEFRRRVAIEAQTLARLCHPNIVQIITAGVTEDRRLPYFVMELLRGRTLRETLDKKGKLETTQALDVAIQILDALDHAHGRGVIHRDVKPENVFLHRATPDARVEAKLLDFGVVAFLREVPGLEEPPGLSPRYAAPELLDGSGATPASDLYSMGLVLYEMLSGHGPFDDAGDLADIARARLTQAPGPLPVEVPVVLEDLIKCALERDPALRPDDAFAFAETLRVLSGRISRLPQRTSLLSSEPPPPSLPSISEIPAALVQADWRPPLTPRPDEIESLLEAHGVSKHPAPATEPDREADDGALDARGIHASEAKASRRGREAPSSGTGTPSLFAPGGAGRDALLGIAVGLAVLLVALGIVMFE